MPVCVCVCVGDAYSQWKTARLVQSGFGLVAQGKKKAFFRALKYVLSQPYSCQAGLEWASDSMLA